MNTETETFSTTGIKVIGYLFMLAFLSFLAAMLVGCMNIGLIRTNPDGTRVDFHASTLFGNSAISKLDVDHKTDKTYGGLKIGSLENETATEAIKASGEAFGTAFGAAAGTALKKSVAP